MAAKKKSNVTYIGTGRRKTAVARVFMTPGTGAMSINGKTLEEYLPEENRLTGGWRPDEYFVGIGRFGIHIDHYRVKEPKTRIILFHGMGEGM